MFTPDESSPSDSESSSEPFVAETWSIVIFSLANRHQVSKPTLQCVCGDEKRTSQSTPVNPRVNTNWQESASDV